jgi:hypothetical protein
MGYNRSYDQGLHRSTTLKSLSDGTLHQYSDDQLRKKREDRKMYEFLDPQRTNKKGDNEGTIIRESLDLPGEDNTTPIIIAFDSTSSMSHVPALLVKGLGNLMAELKDAGVPDPQVMIAVVNDAKTGAQFPIQVSPFESDNKIDAHIQGIILEGGGGGGNHESYELLAYHAANFIHMDALELRGQKGLFFFIGDERMYDRVDGHEVKRVFGVDLPLEVESLDTKDVFADLKEKFEVFFIMSEHTDSYGRQGYRKEDVVPKNRSYGGALAWSEVLDEENILVLEDAENVGKEIARVVTSRRKDLVEV